MGGDTLKTKLTLLFAWLTTNAAALLLLLGMAVLVIATFQFGTVPGLYALGGALILLAIILLIPTERG